jgi:hypothetical protein
MNSFDLILIATIAIIIGTLYHYYKLRPIYFKIQNFSYNGFSGKLTGGFTTSKATFKNWTDDPGIMNCICTDGKERLIPTFALYKFGKYKNHLPIQKKSTVLIGTPSKS